MFSTHRNISVIATALATSAFCIYPTQAQAFTLNPSEGQFTAASDILKVISPWSYQGTLSALDKKFSAKQSFCTPFCTDRTVTASILTTTAPSSYSIEFKGKFPNAPNLRSWGNNSLINKLGEQIPPQFQDLFGLTTPLSLPFAAFTQSYQLDTLPNQMEAIFNVGQFGCPSTVPGKTSVKTAFCRVDNILFGGQLTAFANLQGIADTTNSIPGAERVTIRAQADRITQLLVNNQLLASGDITGSTKEGKITPLNLDFLEDSKTSVDFTFKAGAKVANGTIVPEVGLETVVKNLFASSDEQASAISKYLLSAFKTSDLFETGSPVSNKIYKVELRDTPSLSAGIFGNKFTGASVLAQISASQPIVNYAVVATAVPVSTPEPCEATGLFSAGLLGLILKVRKKTSLI